MGSRKETIKDIARHLNVSPSTVSKALHNSNEISEKTKRRILEYCRTINYRPHRLALNLQRQKTGIIGVIVPQTGNYFFSQVISGIQSQASLLGYQIIIAESGDEFEREKNLLELFSNGYTDGILISLAKETLQKKDFGLIRYLKNSGFPLIFFDRSPGVGFGDKVIINDRYGGYIATKHLIEIGRRRMAIITTQPYLRIGWEREQGYRQALKEAGIPIDESLIIRIDERLPVSGQIENLFRLKSPPDGIFAVNVQYASIAMNQARKYGFKIPENLSVIGFSDELIAQYTCPPLSTVAQFGFKMGEQAVNLIYEKMEKHPGVQKKTIVLEPEIIVRASTQPVK